MVPTCSLLCQVRWGQARCEGVRGQGGRGLGARGQGECCRGHFTGSQGKMRRQILEVNSCCGMHRHHCRSEHTLAVAYWPDRACMLHWLSPCVELLCSGGADGPGGVLVCAENFIIYKNQDHEEVRSNMGPWLQRARTGGSVRG